MIDKRNLMLYLCSEFEMKLFLFKKNSSL